MAATVSYTVRPGFVFTDESGAAPRAYAAGESVQLPATVGDCAHQLERTATPAPRKPRAAAETQPNAQKDPTPELLP